MQNGNAGPHRGSPETQPDPPPKERLVIAFQRPHPPTLVATSPTQMTLLWKELQLKDAQQETRLEGLVISFALLMKLVSPRPAPFLVMQSPTLQGCSFPVFPQA